MVYHWPFFLRNFSWNQDVTRVNMKTYQWVSVAKLGCDWFESDATCVLYAPFHWCLIPGVCVSDGGDDGRLPQYGPQPPRRAAGDRWQTVRGQSEQEETQEEGETPGETGEVRKTQGECRPSFVWETTWQTVLLAVLLFCTMGKNSFLLIKDVKRIV